MKVCLCPKLGIIYYPVPKNGGTSLRNILYRLETGKEYPDPDELFRMFGTSGSFEPVEHPGMERIAVLRDPVERFLSAYRSRVIVYREIRRSAMQEAGIPESIPEHPSLEEFLIHLDHYRRLIQIYRHTNSQTHFLGGDPAFYHHLFRLEEPSELEGFLAARVGFEVRLPRLRVSCVTQAPCPDAIRSEIHRIYESDYRFLHAAFSGNIGASDTI
jgi:hypothetical protein